MTCELGRQKDRKTWEKRGHVLRYAGSQWACWTHDLCPAIEGGRLLPPGKAG